MGEIRADGSGKDVTINGKKFFITHQQVETAWEIGIELTKIIGEPASMMAAAAQGDPVQALSSAVTKLLSKVDAKTSYALAKKILASVEFQGDENDSNAKKTLLSEAGIKNVFHGKVGDLLRLVGETIAFTHEDFFAAITEGVAAVMTKASEKTQ